MKFIFDDIGMAVIYAIFGISFIVIMLNVILPKLLIS